jgi:hypothetical protein
MFHVVDDVDASGRTEPSIVDNDRNTQKAPSSPAMTQNVLKS